MQNRQKIIFFIGGPGSGKGTQCTLLRENLNYHHISTGELVRARIAKADNGLSRELQEATVSGKLLPDYLIMSMVKEEMAAHPEVDGFLIDGCPRTMEQAKIFANDVGMVDQVIYLDASEEDLTERLLTRAAIEHRADDNAETIKTRIKTYNEKTKPVIEYLRDEMPDRFSHINALGDINDIHHTIVNIIQSMSSSNEMTNVGALELLQLYLTSDSFAEAVEKLESRYHAQDFEVSFATFPLMYILQSKDKVRKVLEANTQTSYHNHNFDVAHGHYLNINATQAFQQTNMDHNPIWENIHKGLIKSVGTRESVADLIDKHIHLLFTQTKFTLDKAMERFMLYFWCEYLFGSEVNPDDFIKTRDKLLSAMRYSFYNNSFKNMPILGELTCRFYGWLKGDEFNDVDDELREFISQSSGGLISRLRQQLLASDSFPKELVNQAVLDNAFDLVIVFDFINNAMYESMAEIIKHKINNDEKRRDSYATGLRNAFMFPYRVRVPQQDIQLNDRAIQHGSYVFVNLLKSGVYHSSGPRACVGRGVASWIKDRFFDQLKDIEFNIDSISMPQDRMTPPHADVPKSPERYEVSWRYPRDYLQQHLPSYPFKNIDHFYDVLNAFENPRLFGFVVASWVDEIKKLNIKHDNLVIVAPEMRGIPLAAAIARELDVPQVFIRKPGKIPGSVFSKTYTNAYAEETLEMSEHAALKGKQVILIDDGIASGGTTVTCCKLIEDAGGCVAGIYGMINHLYKDKIDDLHEYDNRVHTLFDFVA